MQEEFRNWVKQQKSIPLNYDDIRIGHTFRIIGHSTFLGWEGKVTKKYTNYIESTLVNPKTHEQRDNIITSRPSIDDKDHIKFVRLPL